MTFVPLVLLCHTIALLGAAENESIEEETQGEILQAMEAAGMKDESLQHVASREYNLQCNWKVFADNYLVQPNLMPDTYCTQVQVQSIHEALVWQSSFLQAA